MTNSRKTNSRRRAFARNVEILFIAKVVRGSFDIFAVVYPVPTLANGLKFVDTIGPSCCKDKQDVIMIDIILYLTMCL